MKRFSQFSHTHNTHHISCSFSIFQTVIILWKAENFKSKLTDSILGCLAFSYNFVGHGFYNWSKAEQLLPIEEAKGRFVGWKHPKRLHKAPISRQKLLSEGELLLFAYLTICKISHSVPTPFCHYCRLMCWLTHSAPSICMRMSITW